MSTTTDARTPASTFLTHFFGGGLIDKGECYVVERFRALANGDIRRWPADAPAGRNARARPTLEVASVDEVRELRPAYNEIIVCTGLRTRAGVQMYSCNAIWGHMLRRRRFPR